MSIQNHRHKIILDHRHDDRLATKLKELRAQHKKIVLTMGSWDLIHIGHARYLKQAKALGDFLIVGVDSDEKVRERKGAGRPVVPQDERLEMLGYFRSVDLVLLKNSAPKWDMIKTIRPDVLVATAETYQPAQLKKLKEFCGEIVVLPYMATTSTSAKIRRVQIGAAKKIESTLTKKLISTIEEVLREFRE